MAYTRTTWVNGSGGGTPVSAANLNNIEVELVALDLMIATIAPVTTLPGSPVHNQRAILVDSTTAPTYAWEFQYSTTVSDSNKWVFVGGSGKTAFVETDEGTASAAYTDLATTGPSFTVPRAGVYLVEFGAQIYNAGGGVNLATVKIGAAAGSDTGAVQGPPSATPGASVFRSFQLTAAASDVLKMVYKTSTGTGQFARRNLKVTPIRVA